jgi:hypothetical protein
MQDIYSPPQANLSGQPGTGSMNDIVLSPIIRTKGWVTFLGVLTIIFCALLALGTLPFIAMGHVMGPQMRLPAPALQIGGIVVLIFSILYLIWGIKLAGFGSAIGRLRNSRSTHDLEETIEAQRKFWAFNGILLIIAIVIVIVGAIGAIAMYGAMMR